MALLERPRNYRVRVNPHNDLGDLARYHVETVRFKVASGNLEGVALDCTSAVIAMAFYNEAILNYVGHKLLKSEWIERASFRVKINVLTKLLKLQYDREVEPFRTVEQLKEARDNLAHGRPMEFHVIASSTRELANEMRPSWTLVAEPEVVLATYENVKAFKDILFVRARIKPGASVTSAIGGG